MESFEKNIENTGWIASRSEFKEIIDPKEEGVYFLKRILVDLILFPFFLLALLLLFFTKRRTGKIVLGTHSIVSNSFLNDLLAQDFDVTNFVFKNSSNGHHNGISMADITPKWLTGKDPYLFGSYFAFIWAIRNFDIFTLYFDGGFLERTLWWRFEPLLLKLFGKKVLLYPYGADVWSELLNRDKKRKYGHLKSYPKYFHLDGKRIKRLYWWSKYANVIVGTIDYVDWLPRIDLLTWHGQIHPGMQAETFAFPPLMPHITAVHYANDGFRKGSHIINSVLERIETQRKDFKGITAERLPREEALALLDNAHIYIDNLIDGFLSYSSLEAMMKGKVVITNLDPEIDDFYRYLKPEYYDRFFAELPIIRANIDTFDSVLNALLNRPEEMENIARKSQQFAQNIFAENETVWKHIFKELAKT